ncbi:MAG: dipeptidase [Rhizomicrobium sp.]
MEFSRRAMMTGTAAAIAMAPGLARAAPTASDADILHHRLICLDTHLDMPANLARPGWNVMERHSVDEDFTQVDYPRMVEGGLKGGFFAIYTPQAPLTPEGMSAMRDAAFLRAAEIREMVAANPAHFELAFLAEDAPRIAAEKKIIVFQSIENSGILGNDVTLLSSFHKLGVRMAGPVHFLVNQFADSATDKKHWGGLSPLGRQFVQEANDLGVVLDASHASDDVFDQMLEMSRAPIICSHSGCRAVHDHPRNLDDARIKKLAAVGGSIQMNTVYLVDEPSNPERQKAESAAMSKVEHLEGLTPAQATAQIRQAGAEMKEINRKYPAPRATFDMYMKNILHALDLVGPDHVGVGCDWDGGGGVAGMDDVAAIPKITERLVKLGYTQAQLANFWGGNALRILGKAHAASKAA